MPKITLTELREKAHGRPENLTIALEDGTEVTLVHLLLLPQGRKDQYLDALEKFMALSVDETGNRAGRRAADKAAGRKVGTSGPKVREDGALMVPDDYQAEGTDVKVETETETELSFTTEDVAGFVSQIREGLLDVDKVGDAAGDVIRAAILDDKSAKHALSLLDAIDRAAVINLHLGGDQQGEA